MPTIEKTDSAETMNEWMRAEARRPRFAETVRVAGNGMAFSDFPDWYRRLVRLPQYDGPVQTDTIESGGAL